MQVRRLARYQGKITSTRNAKSGRRSKMKHRFRQAISAWEQTKRHRHVHDHFRPDGTNTAKVRHHDNEGRQNGHWGPGMVLAQ